MMNLMDGSKAKSNPPTPQSANVTAIKTISLLFNQPLAAGLPALSAFTINTPAGPVTPVSVAISTATVTLVTLLTFVNSSVTLGYTPPGVTPLRNAAGHQVAAFAGFPAA